MTRGPAAPPARGPTTRTTGRGAVAHQGQPAMRPHLPHRGLLVGLVILLGGLALVPFPGPGWLIVIVGHRDLGLRVRAGRALLEFVKDKVTRLGAVGCGRGHCRGGSRGWSASASLRLWRSGPRSWLTMWSPARARARNSPASWTAWLHANRAGLWAGPISAGYVEPYILGLGRQAPGCVAQLVRAFASHARGHGFESLHIHHHDRPLICENADQGPCRLANVSDTCRMDGRSRPRKWALRGRRQPGSVVGDWSRNGVALGALAGAEHGPWQGWRPEMTVPGRDQEGAHRAINVAQRRRRRWRARHRRSGTGVSSRLWGCAPSFGRRHQDRLE